jgi:hypothetical protein
MTPPKETRRAEGRGQPGRSPREGGRVRTQSRAALPSNLARVNAAARAAVQTRLTALLHHVDAEALERAFRRQKRQASAGVDGVTVLDYEQNLEANLQDLCVRVHTGRYRPQPVRRVYIPERLAKFGLLLHEDKTRLIAFGRLPAMARQQRGERRPETFAFLASPITAGGPGTDGSSSSTRHRASDCHAN